MNFEMLHPADQIVMLMNRIYYNDMTITSGGNLSIRDEDGTVWITPSGIDKGNLRREDIMQIRPDGSIVGIHRPSVEYPFHLAIYKKRPDIKAVLHAHPPALVMFSMLRRMPDTSMLPDGRLFTGKTAIVPYALPGSSALGHYISHEFEKGANTVILENHGVVVGSETIFSAFMKFEMLEFCARIQINAKTIGGTIRPLSAENLELFQHKTVKDMAEFTKTSYSSEELAIRRDMCALIKRAYGKQLFTSDQGTFSCRLSDGTFVITPCMKDRMYLEPEDLVLIRRGKHEAGKTPSRSYKFHAALYKNNPDIQSVIIAHPPHIMAFAVTEKEIDASFLPEAYMVLRNVHKYPFGATFIEPEKLAAEISEKNPVAIIENDCIVAAGSSLLNTFDKLEMLEYTAKSFVQAASLGGEIISITPIELHEVESTFDY
ncbi:MAG: class II aldolase/adducin family protein [Clostridia bacterium]|nr:class II aldolase/adducin family protein [Clostridia bacterium]MBQ8419087.1 class II aldolase/adducin family protein [Clostridia bacterium]